MPNSTKDSARTAAGIPTRVPAATPASVPTGSPTAVSTAVPERVKQDILTVLNEVIHLLETNNVFGIKELSNHTIHNASVYQDEDSVSVAVLVYALFKLAERKKQVPDGKLFALLRKVCDLLSTGSIPEFRQCIQKIFQMISSQDSQLRLFVEEVLTQARIKKGMKLYDHGISAARSAEVLGVSQWELMNYLGKTQVSEIGGRVSIENRLKLAKRVFSVK